MLKSPPDIYKLLQQIDQFTAGSPLDKFISEATFPNFKNIAPGTRITFDFPITALVGANGTGKSSILHALWGMPLGSSTARFWFSTAIDPIDDGGKFGVPRYFYKHWVNGLQTNVETRKVRGRRRADYWEPARALESDGMIPMPPMTERSKPYRSLDRWNPTERAVKYINLKCEFSAFDRYFYYPYHTETRAERLQRFQNGAIRLKTVIDQNRKKYSPGGRNAVFKNRALSQGELDWVSYILGRNYISAQYVLHDLYGRIESPSVVFQREGATYSEAFAGSGELAVVRVVMEILEASQFSLILLDEPETSLHPGAQVRLLTFLLEMIAKKKVQIVISTHSPTLIEKLPTRAIKALEDGEDGRSRVVTVTHPQVAFNRLGFTGKTILVAIEDALLQTIVEIALKDLDEGERSAFEIFVPAGGADSILKYTIPTWIDEKKNAFVILDGDKKPKEEIPTPDALSKKELAKSSEIILKLFSVTPLHVSNSQPSYAASYLEWTARRLFFLDCICPEFVLLEALNPTATQPNMTNQQAKSSLISELKARDMPSDAKALSVAAHWNIRKDNPHIADLRNSLRSMLNHPHA